MKEISLKEKSILFIGATGGLGKETVKELIKRGASNITLAGRSVETLEKTREELLSFASKTRAVNIALAPGFDMLDTKKLESAVVQLTSSFDIIFLGAGGVFFTETFQSVNYKGRSVEKTIFQNVIGAHLTIMFLKKFNLINPGARIIYAGGEGARGIKGMIASPKFNSLEQLKDYIYVRGRGKKYNPMDAIGVSKLLGALWVSKLASFKDKGFEIIWFSPGLTVGTKGLRGLPPLKRWFMKNIIFRMLQFLGKAQGPKKGGKKFADCIQGIYGSDGDVLGAPKNKAIGVITNQKPMNSAFTNKELIDGFWNILEANFGVF